MVFSSFTCDTCKALSEVLSSLVLCIARVLSNGIFELSTWASKWMKQCAILKIHVEALIYEGLFCFPSFLGIFFTQINRKTL